MAKLEAGEISLDLEAVPVEEIIDAALAHCSSSLARRAVDVRVPTDLPAVYADRERAKEALVQLINNANLHSPNDQPITIAAELMRDIISISLADRHPVIDHFQQ